MPDFHLFPGPPSPLLRHNVERFVDRLRRAEPLDYVAIPNQWFPEALRIRDSPDNPYIVDLWNLSHDQMREATIEALAAPVITVRTNRWAATAAERNAWLDEVWSRMGYGTSFPDELRVQHKWMRRAVGSAYPARYTRMGYSQTEILQLNFRAYRHLAWYGTPLSMPMREFR